MKYSQIIIKSVFWIIIVVILLIANRQTKTFADRSSQIRGELSAINQKQTNLKSLELEYAKINSLTEQINVLLPDRKTLPHFIDNLEQLANNHTVSLKTDFSTPKASTANPVVTPAQPNADPKKTVADPNSIKFKIEALGQDDNLLKFFNELERTPYFLLVEDFEYSSPTPTQPLSALNLTVKLYVDANLKP